MLEYTLKLNNSQISYFVNLETYIQQGLRQAQTDNLAFIYPSSTRELLFKFLSLDFRLKLTNQSENNY